jgi:hypothetical protein
MSDGPVMVVGGGNFLYSIQHASLNFDHLLSRAACLIAFIYPQGYKVTFIHPKMNDSIESTDFLRARKGWREKGVAVGRIQGLAYNEVWI